MLAGERMIVTIDGPSGSGKSTAAKALAKRLGVEFLDTGSMYRAIALALLRRGTAPEPTEECVAPVLCEISLDVRPGRVWLDGEEVTELIRTADATNMSSKIAVLAGVRRFLTAQQRATAKGRDIICEGRDQGTIVFPEAKPKFFLTASLEARAQRRFKELRAKGEDVDFDAVLHKMEERDRRDSSRDIAPLRPADDALTLDTSAMPLDEVLEWMEREIRRCIPG